MFGHLPEIIEWYSHTSSTSKMPHQGLLQLCHLSLHVISHLTHQSKANLQIKSHPSTVIS